MENPPPASAMTCSRCTAPIPAGALGGVVKCPYCGQETRVPGGAPRLAGLSIQVVGSSHSLEERMATTRAANQKLIDDDRRRALRIAIPIVVVAVVAGVLAILYQAGWF
jgi:hypothetical protein